MTDAIIPAAGFVPATQPRGELFAPGTKFQLAWDSTSLGLLKECPRKYYYQIVLGWRPRHENVHLIFGRLYHAALEAYDHFCASIGKLEGGLTDDEHMAAIRAAVRRALAESGTRTAPPCPACNGAQFIVSNPDDPLPIHEQCELCRGTGTSGDPVWTPWRSDDPNKNMWTLLRSVVWYCDYFRSNPLRTVLLSNGKPAVELSFYFEAGTVNGLTYAYCGHLDRVAQDPRDPNSRPSPHDRKTTKGQIGTQFWNQFSPHNQFSLYSAACAVHYHQPTWGLVVDAAQVLVNSTSFARQFIPFPPAVIEEWLREAHVWIEQAERYAEAAFWPRNDKSCGNYGGCSYAKICRQSQGFRQAHLEADFRYDPWNPLIARGDI